MSIRIYLFHARNATGPLAPTRASICILVLVFVHDRQQLGASADTAHLFINVLAHANAAANANGQCTLFLQDRSMRIDATNHPRIADIVIVYIVYII